MPGLSPLEPDGVGDPRHLSEQEAFRPRRHAGLRNGGREGSNVDPPGSPLKAAGPTRWSLPGTSRRDLGLGPNDLVFRPPVTKARGADNIRKVAASQPSFVSRRRGRVNSGAPGVEERARNRPIPATRGAVNRRDGCATALSARYSSIGGAIIRDICVKNLAVLTFPLNPGDRDGGAGRDTPVR